MGGGASALLLALPYFLSYFINVLNIILCIHAVNTGIDIIAIINHRKNAI
jgi:hypothetical protein